MEKWGPESDKRPWVTLLSEAELPELSCPSSDTHVRSSTRELHLQTGDVCTNSAAALPYAHLQFDTWFCNLSFPENYF